MEGLLSRPLDAEKCAGGLVCSARRDKRWAVSATALLSRVQV